MPRKILDHIVVQYFSVGFKIIIEKNKPHFFPLGLEYLYTLCTLHIYGTCIWDSQLQLYYFSFHKPTSGGCNSFSRSTLFFCSAESLAMVLSKDRATWWEKTVTISWQSLTHVSLSEYHESNHDLLHASCQVEQFSHKSVSVNIYTLCSAGFSMVLQAISCSISTTAAFNSLSHSKSCKDITKCQSKFS